MVDGHQPRQPAAMISDTIVGRIAILVLLALAPSRVVNALSPGGGITRRDVLVGGTASVVAGGGLVGPAVPPGDFSASADEFGGPIAVIGAGGRTGALCVKSCLDRGLPVRALTRSGGLPSPPPDDDDVLKSKLLTAAPCDVRDPAELAAAVAGCRGVIYAASASKRGGSPKEIDNVGVVSAGEACLKSAVARYVVISSTAVTRPKSLGYIFTDVTVGGIMGEKRKGEDGVRAAFHRNAAPSGRGPSAYTIIRPGGLEEPKKNAVLGPGALEISQGDALAGIVSRADLAEVAVEMALSGAPNVRNAAFELYYTDSVQPCEGRFKNLLDGGGDVPRLHGDTYESLFRGIRPDGDYYVPL